jgi:hypothetical protein
MENLPRPRHSRRDRARALFALFAAAALLVGCTTTHALGRIDDPAVRAEVDGIAAHGHVLVHVRPPPGTRPPQIGDRVTGVIPQGLVIEPTRGQPLLVTREQVTSLSRYDHLRGARDGAIGAGVAGFVVGLTIGILLTNAGNAGCSDDCASMRKDPVALGFGAGAVLGGIAAVLGAGLGALAGHEDRYEITSVTP